VLRGVVVAYGMSVRSRGYESVDCRLVAAIFGVSFKSNLNTYALLAPTGDWLAACSVLFRWKLLL
jgi:hypothetical protein